MTDRPNYVGWDDIEKYCRGLYRPLDAALVPRATEIARSALGDAQPWQLSPAWLQARGFAAVVRPDTLGIAISDSLVSVLRQKRVETCVLYSEFARFAPEGFLGCELSREAFDRIHIAMFLGDTLLFDLDQTFAIYECQSDDHVVMAPERDLPAMLGESFDAAAERLERELVSDPYARDSMSKVVRRLGGPQARLMGLA
ncbi:MAG: hypothetical protein JWM77_3204 [Rhodospirillales bacterium]|nr:hypothetical protein [Rhodospirillales bacterium]